jgi:hypothetical protein
MTRVARAQQWTEAACYHILNRGHNREIIFPDDTMRLEFLHLLQRYRDRFGLGKQNRGHSRLQATHQLLHPRQAETLTFVNPRW